MKKESKILIYEKLRNWSFTSHAPGNLVKMALYVLTIACSVFACAKQHAVKQQAGILQEQEQVAGKQNALAAAQPLPGGKTNFSVALGNIDATPWVRVGNWTFNAAAGTVAATFWSWFANDKHNVEILGSHRCTQDGVSKIVNTYTPYGFMKPAGIYQSWGGSYQYDTVTGRLDITWTSGAGAGNSESWIVSLPEPGLARVKFVDGSSTYHVTHGRGYGSNASWSTFKTMSEVPKLTVTHTTGRSVRAIYNGSTLKIEPGVAGTWLRASWATDGLTVPSGEPKNTRHVWKPSKACDTVLITNGGTCKTNREGILYHLSSENTGRQMSWVNFCACLSPNESWPAYGGNMHPHAMIQIIDDNGVMKGIVGIEAQNPPSTGPQRGGYPRYQLQLWDLTVVPGS